MLTAHAPLRTATVFAFPTATRPPPGTVAQGFTVADRVALQGWSTRAALIGYSRVVIEPGMPGAAPDRASYALIYERNDPWSRWGLAREHGRIVAWCSRTGADLGEWDTMAAALAALK